MNTAKRDKIILSVLVIAIICVVMFYVSVKPNMNEIKELNADISSARDTIDSLKGKSLLINDLKKQLEEAEAEVKAAEGDMTNFDDYALYLSDFQDITENATETSISFTSTVPSESGYYTLVQAKIEFLCEYDDLKEIVTGLLEKKVHCYDVSITKASSDDDGTLLKVSFTADYVSRSGAYESGNYDFTSGNYGLDPLFEGSATGGTASGGNTNSGTEENVEENTETTPEVNVEEGTGTEENADA